MIGLRRQPCGIWLGFIVRRTQVTPTNNRQAQGSECEKATFVAVPAVRHVAGGPGSAASDQLAPGHARRRRYGGLGRDEPDDSGKDVRSTRGPAHGDDRCADRQCRGNSVTYRGAISTKNACQPQAARKIVGTTAPSSRQEEPADVTRVPGDPAPIIDAPIPGEIRARLARHCPFVGIGRPSDGRELL